MNTGHAESIPVDIFGRTYLIRSKDDKQYVENLAKMVHEKMLEVERTTKTVDSVRLAVLAALNLGDEFIRTKEHYKAQIQALESEREKLLEMITDALAEDTKLPLPDA